VVESSILDFILKSVESERREQHEWWRPLVENAGDGFIRSVRRAFESAESLGDEQPHQDEVRFDNNGPMDEDFDDDGAEEGGEGHNQVYEATDGDDDVEGEGDDDDDKEEGGESVEEDEREHNNVDREVRRRSTRYRGVKRECMNASVESFEKLSKPLKVTLQRGQLKDAMSDFGAHILIVEPLATLSALENFLLPRVYMKGLRSENSAREYDALTQDDCEVEGRQRNCHTAQDAGIRFDLFADGKTPRLDARLLC